MKLRRIDNLIKIKHSWEFDLPWHMVKIKKWFYMVNTGYIENVYFLHVRFLGIRSLWMIEMCCYTGEKYIKPKDYCPHWQTDGLTQEERK